MGQVFVVVAVHIHNGDSYKLSHISNLTRKPRPLVVPFISAIWDTVPREFVSSSPEDEASSDCAVLNTSSKAPFSFLMHLNYTMRANF